MRQTDTGKAHFGYPLFLNTFYINPTPLPLPPPPPPLPLPLRPMMALTMMMMILNRHQIIIGYCPRLFDTKTW